MKLNEVTYRAVVNMDETSAVVRITVYDSGEDKGMVCFDFVRTVRSLPNTDSTPSSRSVGFEQTFLALVVQQDRNKESQFITDRLQVIYGTSASVAITKM